MTDSNTIHIDLDSVIRQRLPRISKLLPAALVEWMKRTICQDRLNEILDENESLEGADFARGALRSLDITVDALHEERLPDASHRRVVYVSNHPLGGLDGMALIDYVQRRHGGRVHFVVNDLLSAVKPLESVFLPVNKHGKQSRDNIRAIDEAFTGGDPIIMFPAGMVSRLQKVTRYGAKERVVCDLPWQKMFVNKAYESRRDVIPVFFSGENSRHFYRMANLRRRLGIKFNFEMIYLPQEMVKMEGANLMINFGTPISWQTLKPGPQAGICAYAIRDMVYAIPMFSSPGKKSPTATAAVK